LTAEPRTPVALVIFDCDGVLIDSEPIANRVLAQQLETIGLPMTVEDVMAQFRALPISKQSVPLTLLIMIPCLLAIYALASILYLGWERPWIAIRDHRFYAQDRFQIRGSRRANDRASNDPAHF